MADVAHDSAHRLRSLLRVCWENSIRFYLTEDSKTGKKGRVCSYNGNQSTTALQYIAEVTSAALPPIQDLWDDDRSVQQWWEWLTDPANSDIVAYIPSTSCVGLALQERSLKGRHAFFNKLTKEACREEIYAAAEHFLQTEGPRMDTNGPQRRRDIGRLHAFVWNGLAHLMQVLYNGIENADDEDAVARAVRAYKEKADEVRRVWLVLMEKKKFRVYEHIVLDHGAPLLEKYPHGLSAYSQSSHEKCNGDQVSFLARLTLKSTQAPEEAMREEQVAAAAGSPAEPAIPATPAALPPRKRRKRKRKAPTGPVVEAELQAVRKYTKGTMTIGTNKLWSQTAVNWCRLLCRVFVMQDVEKGKLALSDARTMKKYSSAQQEKKRVSKVMDCSSHGRPGGRVAIPRGDMRNVVAVGRRTKTVVDRIVKRQARRHASPLH